VEVLSVPVILPILWRVVEDLEGALLTQRMVSREIDRYDPCTVIPEACFCVQFPQERSVDQ
jgi:hypothetical protein